MLLTFYIKTFKILTCSVLILGLKLYRFGLFSKGFYCLLFNVLFVPAHAERFLLYITTLSLSILFLHFFYFFCKNFFPVISSLFLLTFKPLFSIFLYLITFTLF